MWKVFKFSKKIQNSQPLKIPINFPFIQPICWSNFYIFNHLPFKAIQVFKKIKFLWSTSSNCNIHLVHFTMLGPSGMSQFFWKEIYTKTMTKADMKAVDAIILTLLYVRIVDQGECHVCDVICPLCNYNLSISVIQT